MGIRDRISKALALPSGATTLSPAQIQAMQNMPQSGMRSTPLERDIQDAIVPFPAATPLIPALINAPRDDGRADPRKYEYPVAWNLQLTEQRAIPFKLLREVADQADIVRKCIEIVKATVAGMEWDITMTESAVRRVMEEQELGQTLAAKVARDALQPEMTRAKDFWISPDRMNGMSFQEWIMMALEEMLVLDALSIYPNRTQDNKDLHSLEILDGSTIKPLLNQRGSRPLPPHPAFQQILWGFPRGEFTASADSNGEFTQDDLVYAPRTRRTNTPYGYSPVERCLTLVDLYMKRLQWLRTEFTDGVAPDVMMQTDASFGSNPELLRGYEQVFNDALSGNLEQRRRMRILPSGMNPIFPPASDKKHSSEFDNWLIQQICGHFGVLPTQLGMTASGALGETGHQQGEASTAENIGMRPLIMWLEDLLNQLSYRFLDMPKDLRFQFSDGTESDEMSQTVRRQMEFFSGLKPLNEVRSEMGLPLFSFPEADQPLVVAGSVLTPVAAAFEMVAVDAGETDQQALNATNDVAVETESKSAELTQFIKWSKGDRKRDFMFKSVDGETADRLNHLVRHDTQAARDLAAHLRKAGGVHPKVHKGREPFPKNHPARTVSDKLVRIYTARFASVGSVDADRLASQFLETPTSAPRQWLKEKNVVVYGADAVSLLEDLFYESAWMGTVGARVLVRRLKKAQKAPLSASSADWDNWKAGDADAAKKLVADNMGAGMRAMLDRAAIEIKGINDTTLDRISNILSRGVDAGSTPAAVSKEIRDLVGDPRRAEMIANTEMARAVNASNVDEYRSSGVTMVEWQTAGDDGVCEECAGNEADNPYEIGSEPEAPAHPNCGCQIVPAAFEDLVELTPDEQAEADSIFGDVPIVEPDTHDDHANISDKPELVTEEDVLAMKPDEPAVRKKPKAVEPELVKVYRNAIDQAIDKLNDLAADDEGRIEVPWVQHARPKIPTERWADAKLRSFLIEELQATQKYVKRETVQWHIEHLNDSAHDNRAMPNVLVADTEYLIYDGHHRLVALWLLGADTANCWKLEI
jgi:SPP1 gp7 family putative phage head morphogenesis protein